MINKGNSSFCKYFMNAKLKYVLFYSATVELHSTQWQAILALNSFQLYFHKYIADT